MATQPTPIAPKKQETEAVTVPPVVTETKPAPVAATRVQLDFEGAYQEYLSGAKGTHAQVFFNSLEEYIAKMSPGMMNTAQNGMMNQFMFWHAINAVLNGGTDSEFKRIWTVFLWKVSQNTNPGAFARTHAFRFYEAWDKGKEIETAMQSLMDLILQTCKNHANSENKSQMGIHFDLNRGLKVGFTDKARTRLTSYYSYLVIAKT